MTDWKTFLPLVKQLSDSVTFMEFGGNYLPAILQADAELHHAVFKTVSLAPPSPFLTGDGWVDTWSHRARTFQTGGISDLHSDVSAASLSTGGDVMLDWLGTSSVLECRDEDDTSSSVELA